MLNWELFRSVSSKKYVSTTPYGQKSISANGLKTPCRAVTNSPTLQLRDHSLESPVPKMAHLLPIDTLASTFKDAASKNHQIRSTHGVIKHDWSRNLKFFDHKCIGFKTLYAHKYHNCCRNATNVVHYATFTILTNETKIL